MYVCEEEEEGEEEGGGEGGEGRDGEEEEEGEGEEGKETEREISETRPPWQLLALFMQVCPLCTNGCWKEVRF